MKRIAILFLVIFLAGGVVMAQVPGLSAGGELGILDFNDIGDTMFLRPYASYESIDLIPGLDVYAELGIPFWVSPEFWLGLDINLFAGFSLDMSYESTLTFFAENVTFLPVADDGMLSTKNILSYFPFDWSYKFSTYFCLGVKYTYAMDFGDVYAMLELPFNLIVEGASAFDFSQLNLTVGVNLPAGVGGGLVIVNNLGGGVQFFERIIAFGSYEAYPLYAGLKIGLPLYDNGFKFEGMTLIIEGGYHVMENLLVYGKVPILGLFSDGNATLGLIIGAKYSF